MKHLARAVLLGLVAAALACESDAPVPSGRLSTPSGLVYVPREGTRRDLYIADSDAEGVRLFQSELLADADGKPQLQRAFVPAPAVYFPLLISTPGFPTRLAASADGLRVYALAPTSRSVYVIDGTPLPLAASPNGEGASVLLDIALETFAEPTWVPTDVEVLPGEAPGRDLLLIAFDVLGDIEGRLLAVVVDGTGGGARVLPATAATRPIAPGPRSLVLRGEQVVASSGGGNAVSVVSILGEALGDERRLDVGGPTAVLVDAEDLGLLAFRMDAERVAVLAEADGVLGLVGSVAMRGSPVADGAYGRFESLSPYRGTSSTDQTAAPDVLVDLPRGEGGVSLVAVVHADGDMSFLIPAPGATPPLKVAEDRPASITRLSALFGDVSLAECPGATAVCSETAAEKAPACDAGVVTRTSTRALPLDLRATYQGALARWRRTDPAEASPIRLESATSSATMVRVDGDDFAARQIGLGDVVELLLEAPLSCGARDDVYDLQGAGVVEAVTEAGLLVTVPITETDALGRRLADLVACAETVGWFGYEVHPAGDELVIASVEGIGVETIHRRIPLVDSSTQGVHLELEPGAPLRLDATWVGNFSCTLEARTPGSAACFGDADCKGVLCRRSGACEGSCATESTCAEGVRGCLTRELVRQCSALALSIAPPISLEYNLSIGSDFVPSAPDEVVFDPLRPGFFVSFPGGREIVEAHATPNSRQLVIDRIR